MNVAQRGVKQTGSGIGILYSIPPPLPALCFSFTAKPALLQTEGRHRHGNVKRFGRNSHSALAGV